MAALIAGLPIEIGGATVNRLCGSSLQAINQASQSIAANCEDVQIAGGVEHMHHIPMEAGFDPSPRYFYRHSPATLNMGLTAENLALRYKISRRAQDEFALRSHGRAAAAWERGAYAEETVAVPDVELERDEPIRPDSSLEKLAALRPAFRPEGTVTAGNASPLNDGAAALLLAGEDAVELTGREPLARIVSRGLHAVDPPLYGIAPVEAANRALERAGIGWGDLELVELNEAFAAQALACLSQWPELDPEIVNVNGGAVALGHPIGASGGRILGTMVHELRRNGGGLGLAAICSGGGQGDALLIEVDGASTSRNGSG
jgi:acetyl-CoA acetyltransferase family protein